ncbi:MAG: 50S ribosomal protein L25 [Nitrospinae bacterium]|nr:50S ribosomal protein L25 [Nitrospinota bacterium]
MSEKAVLTGSLRTPGRKGPARRLRAAGQVPGVIYGMGETLSVTVPVKEVLKVVESDAGFLSVITTRLDGDKKKERFVMIKQLDVHPITDQLVHVDLLELDLDKPVTATIDIRLTGVSRGVKEQGGKLNFPRRSLPVMAPPRSLPPFVTIDITNLGIDSWVTVADLGLAADVIPQVDPSLRILGVQMPRGAKKEGEAAK